MAVLGKGVRPYEVILMVEKVFSIVAAVALAALMLVGTADVVGRYLFNSPVHGAMQMSQLLMGASIFLAWAYTLSKKAHVTVDIFFALYPPRLQAVLTSLMMFLSMVLFAVMAWQSGATTISDWQAARRVNIILIPLAPFKALIALGALLTAIECAKQMISAILAIRRIKRV
jgi:TRAP-type C4-dicarboxylate transport system permease small subunit